MITMDWFIVVALCVFALSWWLRSLPWRYLILHLSAVMAIVAGVAGVVDYRWQDAVGAAVGVILLLVVLLSRRRSVSPGAGMQWFSGSAVGLLVLLAFTPLYLFPVTDLPAPSGEYSVGTRNFELDDSSRPGIFAASQTTPRRLLVRVWYPAGDVHTLQPRPYFTDAEVNSTAAGLGAIMGVPFLFQYTKHSTTNSFTNAPLKDGAKNLPVLFYSQGYTSFAGQNMALMEDLASHGYVVYSIQHSYDAAPTLMPNGDIIPMDPALIEMFKKPPELTQTMKQAFAGSTLDERYNSAIQLHRETIETGERIGVSAPIWLDDRLFVLNALQNGEVPDSVRDVVAAGDFTATGQLGMSFGGSVSGGLCMVDTRCAAGVNMDGVDYHDTPFGQNMPVPFMMFYSDFQTIVDMVGADENTPLRGTNDFSYERPELAGLRSDIYRLMTTKVKHLGISDFTLFVRNPIQEALFGSIDADANIQIQNDFVRGFFDTHLRGLDVGFPARQYAKHARWVKRDTIDEVRQWWLAKHPEDTVQRVVLETDQGEIELALYPKRAPMAVAHFLASLESGQFEGAGFQRANGSDNGHGINLGQGELPQPTMDEPQTLANKLKTQTGIANERGTISYVRQGSGSAGLQLFFNLQDTPALVIESDPHTLEETGHTVFGRVIRGLRILQDAQATSEGEVFQVEGQLVVLSSRRSSESLKNTTDEG